MTYLLFHTLAVWIDFTHTYIYQIPNPFSFTKCLSVCILLGDFWGFEGFVVCFFFNAVSKVATSGSHVLSSGHFYVTAYVDSMTFNTLKLNCKYIILNSDI